MPEDNSTNFRMKELRRPNEQSGRCNEIEYPAFRPKVLKLLGNGSNPDDATTEIGEHMLAGEAIIPTGLAMRIKAKRESQSRPGLDPLASTVYVSPGPLVYRTVSSETATEPIGNSVYNRRLGVDLTMISQGQCIALGLSVNAAFLVQSVDLGGPASDGGVLVGDYLIESNGCCISDVQTLAAILAACSVNHLISIRVFRSGRLIDLEGITLAHSGR